jgi:hypothetical protein
LESYYKRVWVWVWIWILLGGDFSFLGFGICGFEIELDLFLELWIVGFGLL